MVPLVMEMVVMSLRLPLRLPLMLMLLLLFLPRSLMSGAPLVAEKIPRSFRNCGVH